MNQEVPLSLPSRFALDREIGRGGMAVVYRAHDNHLGRHVAIKVLSSDLSSAVESERFQREIALMAKLVHPGIVALFDSGETDGRLFYVMPLVTGETLRTLLARKRRINAPEAAALGADIAEALAYAHGMGIVHRDVKPENVFTVGGRAMLADFGIARLVAERAAAGDNLTTAGMVLGTVAYMSPEQATGEPDLDGRSDLYSLGCVLYELLTGAPPFAGPTAMSILAKHMTEAPRPPSQQAGLPPSALDAIVLQLLAKVPEDRPAHAGDVARHLRAASQHPSTTVPVAAPADPLSAETVEVRSLDYPNGDRECEPVAMAVGRAVASSLRALPGMRVAVDEAALDGDAAGRPTSGAATVITGSVRRSGQRLRVTMHVSGIDGTPRWTENADGNIDDLFALEDAVSDSVVRHFRGQLTRRDDSPGTGHGGTASRGATTRTAETSEADQLVAQGLRAFNQFGPSGGAAARSYLEESKAYFTRALAIDPHHARGLCALGNWYSVAAVNGIGPAAEYLARGRALIFQALAADDRCAEVHCSMGKIALYADDDFQSAARHIRRAAELDPTEPEALRLLSIVHKILGRADDAVNAARAATSRVPDSAPLWNALGDALLAAGRNAEAVDALTRAIGLLPGYGPALERLELARLRLGEVELALEVRSSRMRLSGQRDRAELIDRECQTIGAPEAIRRDVRRELDRLLQQAETTDPFLHHFRRTVADRIVGAHAELGEWREAMDWVERAYERRPGRLRRMLADLPVDYRGLAIDPRYARLLRVAGMEDLI